MIGAGELISVKLRVGNWYDVGDQKFVVNFIIEKKSG